MIAGKRHDKGKKGIVLRVFRNENRVLVEWVNIVTKHVKRIGTQPGQIIKVEAPIHVSNVMLVCPYTQRRTRIGYVFVEKDGKIKKFRYSKIAVKVKWGRPQDYIV